LNAVRRIALVGVLIPLFAAGGCGGGSTGQTNQVATQQSGRPLSKAEFIAQADAICRNHQSRREDLESQAKELGLLNSEKAHRVADLLRQASDNLMAESQELQALDPPSAGVGTLGSIVSIVAAEASVIDDWAQAYDDLDARQIRRLQLRIGVITAKAEGIAQGYGFEVCGLEERAPAPPRRIV
jgi:hypothetical protein